MPEITFLSVEAVLDLHLESLRRHGGSDGIRDQAGMESAIAQPQNDFFYGGADVFGIAAAYAFHIAESQAFMDGNKRTGAASALAFLMRNGVDAPVDDGSVYNALMGIADKRLDKTGLIEVFRRFGSQG